MSQELTYRLNDFEGPLDLLLMLINKNKVSITDIPIAEICDQYLAYIAEAQEMDMDIASEFILMASELILIKSKMLLPRPEEDDEDPRMPLAERLMLYQRAKENAERMHPLYAEYSGRMGKDEDEIPPERGLPLGLQSEQLAMAMNRLLNRLRQTQQVPSTLINPLIKVRVVSVEEKITGIVEALNTHEKASLFFLLKNAEDRPEMMAIFMGILELMKLRRILLCEEAEDIIEDDTGVSVSFRLNPDYVEDETNTESEFDHLDNENGGDSDGKSS